ncbi:sodium-independent sulfate anion transporter isoform X1 [Apis mellifera]|uniref:Sodium-independent sulfate anion transporter isoform X1 n=1 Tax=Apis mellifera TaxID=7460 RepID=A0A7M7MR24_APIME|nr:sodium-independent sulfate anion transporter isoform X1 [Apis mellifera]|eukprot:XP_026299753.1 sodium-independent sulfate anion transporter isoform X1 [Apis mellifera]
MQFLCYCEVIKRINFIINLIILIIQCFSKFHFTKMSETTKKFIPLEEYVSSKKNNDKSNFSIVKYIIILNWLPKYTRLDAVSDFVAGFSLGLTLIPQSIAYAALAGLTAQYGLYSCLMGNFLYLFFGTIKEVSIGPSSLMSLLTLEYTRNMSVDFVVLFCFLAGCVELLMGVLRLGFLVDFISMPVTSGFTSATSIIIIISQLQGLLGLKFKAHNIIDNLRKIFQNIENIRVADLILGLCSIIFLLFFRQLKDMNCCFGNDNNQIKKKNNKMYLKKVLWFLSICRNALVILFTSTIAFYFEKIGSSPFILSGKIQSGLPNFSLPPFSSHIGNETYTFWQMTSHIGSGIIVLPLVSVLANVAIAKAFASGSNVNATQEMLTLGVCNIFGSFVSSMPAAGAFTRSAVISASGVRTPMAGIYVGIMTLLALSFLTPYFYYIPRSTLSAVLISAVIFIIDLKIIKLLWKGCKKDAVAAIVTFLVCVMFGVELGLLIGALFSLIFFLRPSARPKIEVIQCKTQLEDKYIILKPDNGLFYPAANYFCNKMMKIIRKHDENNILFIIDCERIQSIDYTAIKAIELLSANINAEKKKLWFMNISLHTFNSIEAFANKKYFYFIDDEDKISSIFYDDILNNTETTKGQLLENMIEHGTFIYTNDNKKESEIHPKFITNSADGTEEIALMLTSSQEIKQN